MTNNLYLIFMVKCTANIHFFTYSLNSRTNQEREKELGAFSGELSFHSPQLMIHLSSSYGDFSLRGEEARDPELELPGWGESENVVFQFLFISFCFSVFLFFVFAGCVHLNLSETSSMGAPWTNRASGHDTQECLKLFWRRLSNF